MKCPGCNEEVPEDIRFCAFCGAALKPETGTEEAAAAQPAPAVPPAPAQYAGQPPSRGKGLAVWLSILAVLLVGGVAVVLVLLLAGSEGMSVHDYQDQVGRIIKDSHSELAGMDWGSLDPTGLGQQAIEDFEQVSEDLQVIMPEFEDAQAELEAITPPGQAAGLHQDILDYYAESITTLRGMEAMASYGKDLSRASMKMTDGMDAFSSQMSTISSEQEFMTLMDQVLGVMDEFIATASELKPPPFMSDFNTALLTTMREMRGIFLEMKKAVEQGNSAALGSIEAKLEKAQSDFDSNIESSTGEMDRFLRKVDDLDQELQDLTDRLDALE